MTDAYVRNVPVQARRDIQSPGLAVGTAQAQYPPPDAIALLRVRLLGGFCVERIDDGRAVSDWPRRPAKTLVKLLAVQPGHALHREQIIDILWPDADGESALNSFGKVLHAARRALEPRLVRRQDSAYLRLTDAMLALNTKHVVVDVDEFELLAEDALRRGEIEAYQAALALYAGELLPEDRYENWCSVRRSASAELRVRLLQGLAEALERRGAPNEAADQLREVLRHDPTREAVHRQLMLLYARMGTPDQAVRQFHVCEAVLRRELDLAPQPETVSFYNEVLTGGLSPQPSRHVEEQQDQAGARGSGSAPPGTGHLFVGRERAIQRMLAQLERRNEPQPGMIVVSGEAGVGKTRLLEEFAKQARRRGAVTLCGGRGAQASHFACGPFAVALEDYAASRPEAERAELASMYPALRRFVPSLGTGVSLPAQAGLRDYHLDLIPATVQFLTDLARTKPVLLVLGDLNEADAVGLDLIRYLAHLAVRMPLLMVGALRDPDIEAGAGLRRMIEAMTRERLWLRIDLHCLSRQATSQLVRAMLPGGHVSDDILAEVYAQSRGNPLFIRELVEGINSPGEAALAADGHETPRPCSSPRGSGPGRAPLPRCSWTSWMSRCADCSGSPPLLALPRSR
jgi:DNA-binding SARP family transcriptional activator